MASPGKSAPDADSTAIKEGVGTATRQPAEAGRDEPLFVISVAARMAGLHAQTLRHYERVGLLAPRRSRGNVRLYSARDIERARRIRSLMQDLGVNLAGVEMILRLREHISALEREVAQLKQARG